MVEYGCKIEEAIQSEKRKMYWEPRVTVRKLGLKSTVWSRRKK